eukprot:gnl/TRDRNA2_/TRDRNA2_184293_c0_seq1.p2 gnl/TRDRNA2_/TRDRNA2_184293_c0~~gnl/TRDRNA2_/TRDRNA2_184293_c0_seq1.p2  ORF type:complete len:225 (-),score=57.67 gnl/TRDRNA2_/TRDRNA2_184293_c0_seq1:105-779(-)
MPEGKISSDAQMAKRVAAAPTPGKAAGVITLKGSTDIVVEFFGYAINSILYQRGIYAPETFAPVSKYGLSILVTKDKELQEYLAAVLNQFKGWMLRSEVKKLVVVVASQASGQTLERWTFNIQVEQDLVEAGGAPRQQGDALKEQKEIQAIIRQITASVTFLPLLDEPCTFDLLIYTDKETEVPLAWEESDPRYIKGGQEEVKLRSFATRIHKVDGLVAYKYEE